MPSGFDVLSTISQGGTDFADWYTNMRLAEVNQAAQENAVQKAQWQGSKDVENRAGLTNKQIFTMFRKAIAQQESGGDYGALGVVVPSGDRAYGKYQIMGNNIPAWSKEILGRAMTPQEFLRDHKAQEQIARAKLQQAYRTYDSPRQAAMSWFGGAGGVEDPYPEVRQYGASIMDRMRNMGFSNKAANPQSGYDGDLVLPAQGDMSSSYGWRINPVTGQRSFHTGTDIAAAGGSKVRAMTDGRVAEMEWDPIYGWNMVVKHGNGLRTQYSHLGKFNGKLEEGMKIDAGQKLGRVGSTGWSTGPHLHFEVERQGENVNPVKYLRRHDASPYGGGAAPIRPSSGGHNNQQQRPPQNRPGGKTKPGNSLDYYLNQFGVS